MMYEIEKSFEYENGFMATADSKRFGKFVSHLEFFKRTAELRGEIVELGVFKGNSLFRWIKLRDLLENTHSRRIIAFDVFGDFPQTNFNDDKKIREGFITETKGGKSISLKELNSLLEAQGLNKNIDIIEGNILETLPEYVKTFPQLKISLLHIDVDLYEATKSGLEILFPRVVKGGIIILDDYGAFPGANKAIDDFFGNDVLIKKLPFSSAIAYVVK